VKQREIEKEESSENKEKKIISRRSEQKINHGEGKKEEKERKQ